MTDMKCKQILALGLALALSLSLAACGQKADPTEEMANSYTQQLAGLDADTVLFTVNGEDVTAEYYLYWLTYDCYYWDYMNLMYTGAGLDFESEVEEGVTTAQFLRDDARDMASYYMLLEQQAKANDCALSEEQQAEWDQAKADFVAESGQEAYDELLEQLGVSQTVFDRIRTSNYLYQNLIDTLVAEPSDEDLDTFTAENDIYKAKHILICTAQEQEDGTVLLSTGAEPTNADGTPFTGTADEYNEQARSLVQDLLGQIDAADDPIAKFDELMNEYSEDTGLVSYPDGYTFASTDSLVDEFKNTVYDLGYGEYSGVVESDFGYHIILRLSVADEFTAQKMDAMVTQWLDEAEVVTTEAFDALDAAAIYENYKTYQEELAGTDADATASPDASTSPDAATSPDAGADASTDPSAAPTETGSGS